MRKGGSYKKLHLKPYLLLGAIAFILIISLSIGGYYGITGLFFYDNFVWINQTFNSSANLTVNAPLSFGLNGNLLEGTARIYLANSTILNSSLLTNSSFSDYCLEGCAGGEIVLSIEIENGTLYLEGLNSRAENNAPVWNSKINEFIVMINGQLTIDLNDYFSDNETLTYLTTSSDNFNISVIGSTMAITPVSNESVSEVITIIASDMKSTARKEIMIKSAFIDLIEQEVANSPVLLEKEVVESLELQDDVMVIIPGTKKIDLIKREEGEFGISAYDYSSMVNYSELNVIAVRVTRSGLDKLKKNKEINGIYAEKRFNISLEEALLLVKAAEAGRIADGNGVGICLLDTGINGANLTGYNFVEGNDNITDENGHGTLIAAILREAAPSAKIIAAKVCNKDGTCLSSDVLEGLNYCLANKAFYNISVVSGSFGDGKSHTVENCPSDFGDSFDVLDRNGVVNVFASGNDGYSNGVNYPACDLNVIAVSSSDKQDKTAAFSNLLPKVLLAPGENLNVSGSLVSGTSFSVPFVSGGAAMLKEVNNSLNTASVYSTFYNTGVRIENYSRIDLEAALKNITFVSFEFERYCDDKGNCLVQSLRDRLYPCYMNGSLIICPALNADEEARHRRSLTKEDRKVLMENGILLKNPKKSELRISFENTTIMTSNETYYLNPAIEYRIETDLAKPLYVEIGFN